MKFADGPTAEVSTVIDADANTVWTLISDIATPVRFSSELQSTEWLDGADQPAIGARFVGRNSHPAIGEWQTTSVVTNCVPGSVFEWQVGAEAATAVSTWRFSMRPTDDGRIEVTQWCRIGPGSSGLTAAIAARPDKEERIIEVRMAEHANNMQRNLDGLKTLAETGESATES